MNVDVKGQDFRVPDAQQMLGKDKMTGTAYREKFGQALHKSQYKCFENRQRLFLAFASP